MEIVLEQFGRCPCDDSHITQLFKTSHRAIDLGWLGDYGPNRPVKAWKSGVVVATGTDSAGGVYVVLKHEDVDCVWITRYWHFVKGSVVVKKGQQVKQGDKLGIRGNTGISSGVHLHFEIWKCPKGYSYKSSDCAKYAVDPMLYTYLFDGQVMLGSKKLETKPKVTIVERNTSVWQVEVIANKLRIRTGASLSADILCYAAKGIYNVMNSQEADGHLWYQITEEYWIATNESTWTIDLPVKQEPSPVEAIVDLQKQIVKLNTEVELKDKALDDTIIILENAIKTIEDVQKAVK